MKCPAGQNRIIELPNLLDAVVQQHAHVAETVVLETAIQVRSGNIMARVAGNPGGGERAPCAATLRSTGDRIRWGRTARFQGQGLVAVGIQDMVVAQWPEQV